MSRRLAPLAAAVVLALGAADARAQTPAPATDGSITTVAGTTPGFAGDGGPAIQAKLDTPRDVAFVAADSYVIADFANDRVRQVLANGTITTVAGSSRGLSGDGGPATDAQLDRPRGVTALPGGGYLIADTFNDRIRRVAPDGTITTVAGSTGGLGGDGGPATAAHLSQPSDTAVLPGGGFLIADTGNNRIRRVAPDGTITTVAGDGLGSGGDGGPATAAGLNAPRDVAVASDGAILIADTGNNRIRRVAPDGTITTVAGGGSAGLAGDGDPARGALLDQPFSVAPLPHGGFLFADTGNSRVRRVTPLGAIFTVAGTTPGRVGDGGLAKTAQLDQPGAITTAPGGGFLVADTGNAVVRRVSDIGAIPPAAPSRSMNVTPVDNGATVQPAGTSAFQPLFEKDLVPLGSTVDVRTGKLGVTTAQDVGGTQQTARLFEGAFTVTQPVRRADALVTQFRLPAVGDCTTTRAHAHALGAVATAAKAKKKHPRRPARRSRSGTSRGLWVNEPGGNWQTATGSVSAAAVGTYWHTTLTCAGTRVSVREGVVAVRDRVHRRTVVVRAGQSRFFAASARLAGQ